MLPQCQRVGKDDFKKLILRTPDNTYHFSQFLIKYYKEPLFKATVVVSKSNINSSVKRNLIKRRIRALIAKHKTNMRLGFYVVILKHNINIEDLTYEKLNLTFDSFISKNH